MIRIIHTIVLSIVRLIRPKRELDASCIACIELSRMGDVMAMLPALRSLRLLYPASRIVVVVRREYAGILRRVSVADEVLGMERRNILHIRAALRKRRVTLACSMSPATTNALSALVSGKSSIGYLSPPESLPGILDRSMVSTAGLAVKHRFFQSGSIYLRPMEICRALGWMDQPGTATIDVDPEWENSSRSEFRTLDSALHSPYIILHPFSGWRYRSWPADHWQKLIETILRRTRFECVLISSVSERKALGRIAHSGGRIHHAAGMPIEHLAVLLKRSAGYVGNDSGPLHLATAVGVPVIGLFGPAAPAFTAPPAQIGTYLFRQMECSPCLQRRCIRPDDSCMMQLDHDSVFDAIEKLFIRPNDGERSVPS